MIIKQIKAFYKKGLISLIEALEDIKINTPDWDREIEQKMAKMLMRKERGEKYD